MIITHLLLLFFAYSCQIPPKDIKDKQNVPALISMQFDSMNCNKIGNFRVLDLFKKITNKNNFLDIRTNTKGLLKNVILLLFAISNDVELNPGPTNQSTIYPC